MTKLDTININKVGNLPELYHYHINNSKNIVEYFFKKYLNNFKRTNKTSYATYEADSPSGPGRIFISFAGGWFDEVSGEMGNMADFIRKKFPLSSPLGAIHAVFSEYFEFRKYLHKDKDEIDVIDELEIVTGLAQKYGRAEDYYVNGFRVDTIGIYENGDVHYSEFHRSRYEEQPDNPVIENVSHRFHSSYTPNFISHIYGVQKIEEKPNSERLYFAEDPLQQAWISDHVNAPVFIRPDQESYFHNDYNRLVEGKEVILTKKVIPGPFDIEKLSHEKFERDENVDFFSFYEEEMPKEQDWENNALYELLRLELISQKLLMAEYLRKHGIEVIPYPG